MDPSAPSTQQENPGTAEASIVPAMFDEADKLLFKQRKYSEAQAIYQRILEIEPSNVYAINSIAYCVKFTAATT